MKAFATLFRELDKSNKTNTRLALLREYFRTAPEEDRLWALALFTGRRPSFKVKSSAIKRWAGEQAGIPEWLFQESYHHVGDLGETIALLLPAATSLAEERSLSDWFTYLLRLPASTEEEQQELITRAWQQLSPQEIFVFNKLLMGSFRIGVAQTLVVRALAEALDAAPGRIMHRVMGNWNPQTTSFAQLLLEDHGDEDASRLYPFCLAYALESNLEDLGDPAAWMVEWKWDGIRAQLIRRKEQLFIWTRGEELATDKFPELHVLRELLPEGTVLDGEIVSYKGERPMAFNVLQTRIGRKQLSKKILSEAPVAFIAYDLPEYWGRDIRELPQEERRRLLETLYGQTPDSGVFRLSPLVAFSSWADLAILHKEARSYAAEGFMLKQKQSHYLVGRKKGGWWKWKTDPLSIDAVLVYAQRGHGRRAELYTDYTFAVWDADRKLVPFAKAYSGLTDKEIAQVDKIIRRSTLEKFGPVRTVKPELVFEIGFEGINESSRHKSGIAVRFPRILRWRTDKQPEEADTLENLKMLLNSHQ